MNRKKTTIGMMAVVAAASLTVGVVAANTVQTITAELRPDMKVIVDGQQQTFTDVNGQEVYPVLYNGTTYLPVRAISGLMGKAVAWDGETQTVTLGEKDAFHSVVAMPDQGNGYAGAKIIDATQLTFPYGELKEEKPFSSGIRLREINSAEKEFSLKLDGSYATMQVTLHNPADNQDEARLEIRDKKTGIVLLSQTLEPGQFFEATNVNLNATDELEFCATGKAGGDGVVYFLDPQVR